MKSISASIVVLSGSLILASGAWVPHSDTSTAVMIMGAIVGLIGLAGWLRESNRPD